MKIIWWMQKLRTAVIASILVSALLVMGVATWAWKEGVTLQYVGSMLMARLHLIQVSEPLMVLIPGGTFWQGDGRALSRTYEHWVRGAKLKPFALGKFEMTFQEYDQFVKLTGRRSPDDEKRGRERRPVINVSWEDAVAYAKWLSLATEKSYRLPTESEWEYAARSGGQDERWAGTSDMKELEDYAVYAYSREGPFASPVGSKKPNELGLYDMTGNVWEWVEDCWHEKYEGAPGNGKAWLDAGGGDCMRRVIRGGSWGDRLLARYRTGIRDRSRTDNRYYFVGFRLARNLD